MSEIEWVPLTRPRPNPWALFGSTTSTDDGVDFRLRLHDEAPMYVQEDRPLIVQDWQPEGTP